MIELILNGTSLSLDEDQEITVLELNPIFKDDISPEDHSFPFTLPLDANNREALENKFRIDNFSEATYDINLKIDQADYLSGEMQMNQSNDHYAECTVKEDKNIFKELASIKLNTIAPTMPVEGTDFFKSYKLLFQVSTVYWRADFRKAANIAVVINNKRYEHRIIGNPYFYDLTDVQTLVNAINADYPGAASYSQEEVVLSPTFSYNNTYLHIDHLNIHFLNVQATTNLVLIEEITSDEGASQQDVIDFVQDIQKNGDDRVGFPMVEMKKAYRSNYSWLGWVNFLYNNVTPLNEQSTRSRTWEHTYIAMPRLSYIIEIIGKILGKTITGTFFEEPDTADLVIFNNHTSDNYVDLGPGIGINKFNSFFDLNKNLPNISVLDFLNILANNFGIYVSKIEETYIEFSYVKDQLISGAIDWRNRTADSNRKHNLKSGINVNYAKFEQDEKQSRLATIKLDEGEFVYDMDFTTLFKDKMSLDSIDIIPICHCDAEVTNGNSSIPLTFIYDRGMRASDQNVLYAASSNDNFHFATQIGNRDLLLNGIFFNQHLVDRLSFQEADEITLSIRLNIYDIITLKSDWKNAKRIINTVHGEAVCIIKSIEFTASVKSSISNAKVTLKRIE